MKIFDWNSISGIRTRSSIHIQYVCFGFSGFLFFFFFSNLFLIVGRKRKREQSLMVIPLLCDQIECSVSQAWNWASGGEKIVGTEVLLDIWRTWKRGFAIKGKDCRKWEMRSQEHLLSPGVNPGFFCVCFLNWDWVKSLAESWSSFTDSDPQKMSLWGLNTCLCVCQRTLSHLREMTIFAVTFETQIWWITKSF